MGYEIKAKKTGYRLFRNLIQQSKRSEFKKIHMKVLDMKTEPVLYKI